MPVSLQRTFVAASTTAILLALSSASFGQAAGGGGASGAAGGAGGPVGGVGASGGIGGIGGGGAAGVGAGSSGAGVGGATVGGGALGAGSLNPSQGSLGGAHQGNILTGPGASGTPENYFRGAMPGMGQFPQQSPSGSLGGNGVSGRGERSTTGRSRFGQRSGTGGGRAIGRGVGPAPKGGDENPAETLLDEMNGTHNGRRTGHAALRPPPKYQRGKGGLSSDPPSLTPQRIEERAVYFAKRGAYEDMVYHPYQGSYRRNNARATTVRRSPSRTRQVY